MTPTLRRAAEPHVRSERSQQARGLRKHLRFFRELTGIEPIGTRGNFRVTYTPPVNGLAAAEAATGDDTTIRTKASLMPWSAKALELVRQQYASVGTAARVGLGEAVAALQHAVARGVNVGALLEQHKVRQDLAQRFAQAYRHYCWPVESLRDIRIAPFHVMATE